MSEESKSERKVSEKDVALFLIDKGYHLTALELFCETYERYGKANEELSSFFEDSANFLMFEDLRSISERSSSNHEQNSSNVSSDAMRIKDDRIATLENEVRTLKASLEKVNYESESRPVEIVVDSPSEAVNQFKVEHEDPILRQLIYNYMQSKGLRLAALAFNNETQQMKSRDKFIIQEDVTLQHLLRNYMFMQTQPDTNDEMDALRSENDILKEKIISLNSLLDSLKSENLGDSINKKIDETQNYNNYEIPSTNVLNAVIGIFDVSLKSIKSIEDSSKFVDISRFVIEHHQSEELRTKYISEILNLYEDPTESEQDEIVKVFAGLNIPQERVEREILPPLTELCNSESSGRLCFVAKCIAVLSPLTNNEIRNTLITPLKRLFYNSENSKVKIEAIKSCSILLDTFKSESNVDFKKLNSFAEDQIFDGDDDVCECSLKHYIPALLKFLLERDKLISFFDYWLDVFFRNTSGETTFISFSNVERSVKVIREAIPFLIKEPLTPNQHLSETDDGDPNCVVCHYLSYIKNTLFGTFKDIVSSLFSSDVTREFSCELISSFSKQFGQKFCELALYEDLMKAMDLSIESRKNIVLLIISSVLYYCSKNFFITKCVYFTTLCCNEQREFKPSDISNCIKSGLVLLMRRENESCSLVLEVIRDLSTSQTKIRKYSVVLLKDILSCLTEQNIIEGVIPIVRTLLDTSEHKVVVELITVVASIAVRTREKSVVEFVKDLFAKWFRSSDNMTSPLLSTLKGIMNENLNEEFRNEFLANELLDLVIRTESWTDESNKERVLFEVFHIFKFICDLSENVNEELARSLLDKLSNIELLKYDENLVELRSRYFDKDKSKKDKISFFKRIKE